MNSQPTTEVALFLLPSAVLRSGHGVNWLSYVGIAEQTKAAQYRHPDDALNYAAQQSLMRAMAASALGIRPTLAAEIPVDRTCYLCTSQAAHGKPRIAGVNMSMSRSNGMVAGAYTQGDMSKDGAALLGADIERLRGSFLDSYDRVALTDSEAAAVAEKPKQAAQLARLMLWSAKEAVLKATGYGLAVGPQTVEFSPANFPTEPHQVADYRSTGVLRLSQQPPQTFWVSWQIEGEHCVAVALNQPFTLNLYPVSTPLEVKKVLEPQ